MIEARHALRPLGREDLDAVLDLWEALMADGHAADARYRPASDARGALASYAREVWTRSDPFPAAWVAEAEGLVGFVGILPTHPLPVLDRPPAALITDLYVRPDHRRRGLGRALVAQAIAAARAAGYPAIEVGTLAADPRAVGFWSALGFSAWKVVLLAEGGAPPPPVRGRPVGFGGR